MSFTPHPAVLALCAILLLSLTTPVPARKAAQSSRPSAAAHTSSVLASVRQVIQAEYNAQNVAFAHQDLHGYLAHRTPDFLLIDEHGPTPGLKKLRTTLGPILQGTKSSSATTTILAITSQNGGVLVTTHTSLQILFVRPDTHKIGHVIGQSRNSDFWVQTPNGWAEKKSKELSSKMVVNGQAVD